MIVSIHQPAYLPWLGYFHKIAASDTFVLLDTTQYEKNSFINRNKIKTLDGGCFLTIPISTSGKFKNNALTDTQILGSNWKKKHWKSIQFNYKNAPYFSDYESDIKQFYDAGWSHITDLSYKMLKYFLKQLKIDTDIVRASNLDYPISYKTELVLNICKSLGASYYISGALGQNYLEISRFKKEGIKLLFQEYKHPIYNQLFGDFEPYMSILDLLFNEGPNSRDIILKDQILRE